MVNLLFCYNSDIVYLLADGHRQENYQLSVRKGLAGRQEALVRLQTGLLAQAYLTDTGKGTLIEETRIVFPSMTASAK
jgi:hypothetical protein